MKFKLSNDQINSIVQDYVDFRGTENYSPEEYVVEIERRLNLLQVVESEEDFFEIVASVAADLGNSFDSLNETIIVQLARFYSNNVEMLRKLATRLGLDPYEVDEVDNDFNFESIISSHLGYGVPEALSAEMDYSTDEEIARYCYEADIDKNDIAQENKLFRELDADDDERLRRQSKEDKLNRRNGR